MKVILQTEGEPEKVLFIKIIESLIQVKKNLFCTLKQNIFGPMVIDLKYFEFIESI